MSDFKPGVYVKGDSTKVAGSASEACALVFAGFKPSVDESQVDESQVDESQVDESQVDESQVDENPQAPVTDDTQSGTPIDAPPPYSSF